MLVHFGIGTDAAALYFLQPLHGSQVNALLIDHYTAGVRTGDDLGAQLMGLFNGVDRYVSGTGNHDGFALQGVTPGLEHFLGEEHGAVTGRFGTGPATAPVQALASQYAGLIAVGHT